MEILDITVTDGPNYWSINRHKLIVMLLDLQELETKPTNEIPGFRSRLEETFPGVYDHHCSEGHPGGFLERVERGTWMGHVIEHIAIELQIMAGLDAGFGRTRGTGNKGEYQVVFDCTDAESGRLTAEMAVVLAQRLVDGDSVDINPLIEDIENISNRYRLGPSTASILAEANRRGIPAIKLEDSSTYQLGYGNQHKKIAATITSATSNLAVETACDKQACRRLFKTMGVPVATGAVVYEEEELHDCAKEFGFPLVVKPISGNHGRGVTTEISSLKMLINAFETAMEISDGVVVERHITGDDYRILMINHQLIAAAKRTPAHVIGDGKLTIKELIKVVNRDPRRGEGHNEVLTKITVDESGRSILRRHGYTLSTVLRENEVLYLNYAANLSKGGTAEDVTESVHPSVVTAAERISKLIGLDICGIDVMAPSLEDPLDETGGVVLEINAAPGLRMHLSPSKGQPINVAAPIVDMLFPNQSSGRIPIIAVTGTNGKTTTTRLISHIMKNTGRRVGYTTTDGIYIDNNRMMSGDCGGPASARFILRDPTVDTAVLECARGGILRAGLGFDCCDVAVVTNVTSDHLGMKGINSLEKMARVKSVVPESAHINGYAVLNADDDYVYAMKDNINCHLVLYSMDGKNKRIQAHRQAGGVCAVYEDQQIKIWEGDYEYNLGDIEHIPLSFEGRARFMIENILAAAAAGYVQDVGIELIRESLRSFIPSAEHTPGRMNMFNFGTFDVMVDYAHNVGGFKGVKEFISQASYEQTIGIVAAVGDRRTEDILELGRVTADIFDHIIIREDSDLRGRQPGEASEILIEGIKQSGKKSQIKKIAIEKKAFEFALKKATAGSLIIFCVENVDEVIPFVQQMQQLFNQNSFFEHEELPDYSIIRRIN